MTLYQIAVAYDSLKYLLTLRFPYPKTRKIRKIYDKIKTDAELCIEEEKKIIFEYSKKDKNQTPIIKDGCIEFETLEDKQALEKELQDLHSEIININFIPVELTADEMGQQRISDEDIQKLKGFVDFK